MVVVRLIEDASPVRAFVRFGITLLAFVTLGFFIALLAPEVGPMRAFDEQGVPGKYGVQVRWG